VTDSKTKDSVSRITKLEAEIEQLRKRTEEGCHWACMDAVDDYGLPMARSHHPDCMKERCRRAEARLEELEVSNGRLQAKLDNIVDVLAATEGK